MDEFGAVNEEYKQKERGQWPQKMEKRDEGEENEDVFV